MDQSVYPGSALACAMERTARSGEFSYLDDAIVFVNEHLKSLGFTGVAFPHVELSLGPGVVAAFITGYSRDGDGTVWFEPPDLLSLEEILSLDPEVESHYATIAMLGIQTFPVYESCFGNFLVVFISSSTSRIRRIRGSCSAFTTPCRTRSRSIVRVLVY